MSRLLITPDADLRELTEPPHTLVVPGGPRTRRSDRNSSAALRARARGAPRLASVCTGAFLDVTFNSGSPASAPPEIVAASRASSRFLVPLSFNN